MSTTASWGLSLLRTSRWMETATAAAATAAATMLHGAPLHSSPQRRRVLSLLARECLPPALPFAWWDGLMAVGRPPSLVDTPPVPGPLRPGSGIQGDIFGDVKDDDRAAAQYRGVMKKLCA